MVPNRTAVSGVGFAFTFEAEFLIKRNQMLLAGQDKTFSPLFPGIGNHLPHNALGIASVTVERMSGDRQQHEPCSVDIILLRSVEHIICQVNGVCRESVNKCKHLTKVVKEPKEIAV